MEPPAATSGRLAHGYASLSAARPHHRSRTARFPPSPQLTPLSATASPRRAMPDHPELPYHARSAVVLRRAPVPTIILEEEREQDDSQLGSQSQGCGRCDMGEYYRRVLRADPGNPLLLRNHGKYLHEVERDLAGAEACYARALLACPGDADLLSLYGRVIWEARREKDRAADYFERAVQAAPDDCYVLGSYASFLWDAEDDNDVQAGTPGVAVASCNSPAFLSSSV